MPGQEWRYDVAVLHLLVSPGHNYFGRPKDGPGDHPTYDLDEVTLMAGRGIVGDRFYGRAAHLDAAVTLLAVEALEDIASGLRVPPFDPLLARRNVVLRGADVNGLRGHEFALEAPDGSSRAVLFGGRPANPCAWMDRVLAPGAHAAMRGRGGLRCRVVADGVLRRGAPCSRHRSSSTRRRPAAPPCVGDRCPEQGGVDPLRVSVAGARVGAGRRRRGRRRASREATR